MFPHVFLINFAFINFLVFSESAFRDEINILQDFIVPGPHLLELAQRLNNEKRVNWWDLHKVHSEIQFHSQLQLSPFVNASAIMVGKGHNQL